MAAVVADEATLDFRTAAAHERMRADMREVARLAASGTVPEAELGAALDAYLGEIRGGVLPAPRPAVRMAQPPSEPPATPR